MNPRHRRLVVLRGTRPSTRDEAIARLGPLRDAVLWVTAAQESAVGRQIAPRAVRRLLGASFDAVVLDFHDHVDPDVLGQCHGFVWGGGALILRLPVDSPESAVDPRDVADGFDAAEYSNFRRHFERALARAEPWQGTLTAPIVATSGTTEQAAVVSSLVDALRRGGPSHVALTADRGRGKSAALGLAAVHLGQDGDRVVVTAASEESAAEVLRFAAGAATYVAPIDLLRGNSADVIIVDEAGQLPVPTLQRLVSRHPSARFGFATTTHGYEGTGRGFTLRFLHWLGAREPTLVQLSMVEPIRWGEGDPLERFVFDALLLDAEPRQPPAPQEFERSPLEIAHVSPESFVEDEDLLREFFGLLVQAHYRTTPGDLRRMLDAPNVFLHVARLQGRVVGATMLALEGKLGPDATDDVYWGRRRLRGHALPETLVSHLGRRDAGELSYVRSIRIAVHPDARRLGVASELVRHVHAAYDVDAFGTMFGATPGLLAFRRSLGYDVVRVGASRGTRTGEPAAVMMKPVSDRARALFDELRADLARDLPGQLDALEADEQLVLTEEARAAFLEGLPQPSALTSARAREMLMAYAYGPRTFEAAQAAVAPFVQTHVGRLHELGPSMHALVRARVLDGASWLGAAEAAGLTGVPAAMRALRRAVRSLVELAAPADEA